MSRPSEVVDGVVTALSDLLGNKTMEVVEYLGSFDADAKDFKTTKNVSVLVQLLDFYDDTDGDFVPPRVVGRFTAVCIAKTPNAAAKQATSGDVAADLAAIVHSHLSNGLMPARTTKAPDKIRCFNLSAKTETFRQNGCSAWIVFWQQQFELDPVTRTDSLNRLATIYQTFAMGDANTPDAEAQTDFPPPAEE